MMNEVGPAEPTSYREVKSSIHYDVWEDAMARESRGLKIAGTSNPCDQLLGSSNSILGLKFSMKVKLTC